MEKFRISNDLSIFWSITEKDGSPYNLSDKTVRLIVTHPRGRMDVTSDITVQGNVICWLFRGSKQRFLGNYKITAEIQSSPADRVIKKDIPEAFALVSSSQYEQTEVGRPDINETGNLRLATSLDIFQIMPIIPQVGPNRNWWVDGADTGKSSVGLTAYEFAKEQGYEGTEEEYAAECLAVPVLNEESREATEAATKATEAATIAANTANNASEEASTSASQADAAAASANVAAEKANEAARKAEEAIEAFGPHNIGSIDLFEQIIAQKQNYDLTLEDKEAILNGKVITTSAGNGVVPTISITSIEGLGLMLMFHFNERLYSMCVMWNNDRCYINGFFSFSRDAKFFADEELSETSENSVQNKVVTENFTELFGRSEVLLSDLGKKIDREKAMEYIEDLQAKDTQHDAKLAELSEVTSGLSLVTFGTATGWELGTLSQTGAEASSNNRIRSPYYKTANISRIVVKEGYMVALRYFDQNLNGIDISADWLAGTISLNLSYPYFRLLAKYVDDRTIDAKVFGNEQFVEKAEEAILPLKKSSVSFGLESIPFVLGVVGLDGSENSSVTTRAKSDFFQNAKLVFAEGLKVSCRYYDARRNFIASDDSWNVGGEYIPKKEYPYIRVMVAYVDDRHISDIGKLDVSFEPILERVENLENSDNISFLSLAPQLMQYKSEEFGIISTYSLKSVKQSNAVRGRSPIPIAWLYIDNDTEDMYLVKGNPRGEMKHIGKWDKSVTWNGATDSKSYTIFITPEDDLVCVFRSETLNDGVVGRDSDRKNPIVYSHNDYGNPMVVDFGNDEAPSAWLMSCGADYDYIGNSLHFAEYGRVNLSHSKVWKVLPPYNRKDLWSVSHQWATSGLADAGFKHCHCCEIDPYTGVIYVATGDDDTAAAIYASIDGGDTYTKVAGPNEKTCRLLNFIFTRDYIWWASDSHAERHALFRAKRVNGIMSEIELVTQIPYDADARFQATYITFYAEDKNILLFLDYYDADGFAKPMEIYGYNITEGKVVRLMTLRGISDGVHKIGFRCECSSFYQGLFNKGVTLGWQWVENENMLLNNTADNQLGNVELIVV